MCGLTGIITNNIGRNEGKFFENALYVTALRGMDSTGIITISGDRDSLKTSWIKAATSSPHFLFYKEVREKLSVVQRRAFLGHCRAATIGEVNRSNAHPFHHGHITGTHNGTIHEQFEGRDKYETDSEALFALIAKEGAKEVLESLRPAGAFALAWYDSNDQTINLARNCHRPLFIGDAYNGTSVLYASEKEMLEFAASRSAVKLENVRTLPVNTIFSFPVGEGIYKTSITETPIKPKIQIYSGRSGKTPSFFQKSNNYSFPTGGANVKKTEEKAQKAGSKGSSQTSERWSKKRTKVIDPALPSISGGVRPSPLIPTDETKPVYYTFYGGGTLGEEEMETALADGCAYCGYQVPITDCQEAVFTGYTEYLCGECEAQTHYTMINDIVFGGYGEKIVH